MKRITAKVITISSQMLVVSLFVVSLFMNTGSNDRVTIVYNNNFNKMADRTLVLFEEEEFITSQIDENIEVVLEDNTEENLVKDEVFSEDNADIILEDNSVPLDNVLETYSGILTGYGPDCVGCGNPNTGKVVTSSGYHVSNIVNGAIEPAFTITYDDEEYGEVRIVAADVNIPFYSIVRITVPGWEEPVIAIVLDRGSTVGFENCRSERGCLTQFDLLYPTEAESLGKTQNVKFELLRNGR